MAQYKLYGSGPQFPNGYIQTADTAAEALNKFDAVQNLCGHVSATDPDGKAVTRSDLSQRASAEQAAQREANKNA